MRKVIQVASLCAPRRFRAAGEGAKDKKENSEAFRVPDSASRPDRGYHLTVDTYHVVNGGVMANAQIELHYPVVRGGPIRRGKSVRHRQERATRRSRRRSGVPPTGSSSSSARSTSTSISS